jgi:hypothetical protein
MYGVEAYVQFRSRWWAARARDALDGRALYEGCCFLAVTVIPPIYTAITTPDEDEVASAYFYDDTPYAEWAAALAALDRHDEDDASASAVPSKSNSATAAVDSTSTHVPAVADSASTAPLRLPSSVVRTSDFHASAAASSSATALEILHAMSTPNSVAPSMLEATSTGLLTEVLLNSTPDNALAASAAPSTSTTFGICSMVCRGDAADLMEINDTNVMLPISVTGSSTTASVSAAGYKMFDRMPRCPECSPDCVLSIMVCRALYPVDEDLTQSLLHMV